ncbi:phage tail tape measure protein [Salinimicrobium sp. GXAS 041]|uniref:phage tail tape measure protein n=1 Tax=Salinimicrobium sp. GXAS 041 TaxID=3400806 RepID=UPI003C73D944
MNQDAIDLIIDKKAFQQLTKLQSELDVSHKKFIELARDAEIKVNVNGMNMPALQKQITKTKTANDQLAASYKEQERLEKALIREIQKKEAATESTNRALLKHRVENQQLNKELKRQATLNSEAVGEYKKQSTQLNILRDRYKDLILTTKEETDETRKLLKEIKELDTKLKDVDASVGQHQRSVGNYTLATENLHPALDQVNNSLMTMGTSLDELSASKDPFKTLSASIVQFGKATMTFLLSPVGLTLVALGSLFMLIKRNKDTVLQFDSQLRDVGKTTGLAGEELEGLGDDIIGLSRRLKTVGTPALLEYATVAGQLGVKGRRNILAFAEGLAKLETASDISGEEGASQIARLLTLTDGGVQNISAFGDEIVKLGNNFAATESEILGNATAIAQNTGQYNFGRQSALAYATATKAVGVEAELTGSTIGRTLGIMEKSLRTGKDVQILADLTGKSVEELRLQFDTDAAGVFTEFVAGLNNIDKSGGSVNAQLEKIGITAVRDQRVLGSLATGGFETLQGAIEGVTTATGALDEEFTAASNKLEKQWSRMGIAWDNLVLSIENGQGVFGKFFAWLAGAGADTLEHLNKNIMIMSGLWGGLTNMIKQVKNEFIELFELMARSTEVLMNPIDYMRKLGPKGFRDFLTDTKKQFSESGKNIGDAFKYGFEETLGKMKAENLLEGGSESTAGNYGGNDDDPLGDPPAGLKATKGSIAAIQASISALQEQRDNLATTKDEIREYNKAISKLQEELDTLNGKVKETGSIKPVSGITPVAGAKITTDTDTGELERHVFQKNEKEKTRILKEEQEERRQAVADTFRQFADFYGIDFRAFENLITKKTDLTKDDYVDAAASAASAILGMTRQRYDDELRMAQDNLDAVLNSEKATEEQKQLAREEFRQKERAIKRKQAEDERRAVLFEIAINTAAAIVKALPNIGLSIAAGVLGAAQAAFVASQPIPKFKDGHLLGTYEGPAIINDAPGSNYREIVERKDGTLESPNKRNVLIGMNKGDKVHKSHDSFLKTRNYDDIVQASILTSILNQQEKMTSAELGNAFDHHMMQKAIDRGIKDGFKGVKITSQNHNNNSALVSELKRQRLKDV